MTDTIQFCEERAASYGAVRKSALTAIALDHAIARMKSDTTTIEALQAQVAAKDAALKCAIDHLEHQAKWIGEQKAGYSFESLGEDMPGIRVALGQGDG